MKTITKHWQQIILSICLVVFGFSIGMCTIPMAYTSVASELSSYDMKKEYIYLEAKMNMYPDMSSKEKDIFLQEVIDYNNMVNNYTVKYDYKDGTIFTSSPYKKIYFPYWIN